jgi:hypothetical protein
MASSANNIYWVNIDVRFRRPLDLHLEGGRVKKRNVLGFLQEVGLTAPRDCDVREIIAASLLDSDEKKNCEVNLEHIGVIQEADLQREIFDDKDIQDSLTGDPMTPGIWYRSGRGYYS